VDAQPPLTPTDEETALMRACVHGVMPTAAPTTTAAGLWPRLAAVLYHALRDAGALPRGPLASHLRAAAVGEALRWRAYVRISRDVLTALADEGVEPVVVRGAAVAEGVYPHPESRHCDSVTLLVRRRDMPAAIARLQREGFALDSATTSEECRLRHPSRMPLTLRTELLTEPDVQLAAADVWQRSVAADVTGVRVRRLSATDALLDICVSALETRPRSAADWAVDAWFIVVRATDVSWPAVHDVARHAGAAVPMRMALTYLADSLGAPVPQWILESLAAPPTPLCR
jgi:hypothetical protein